MRTSTPESLVPPVASARGATPTRSISQEILMKITDLLRRYARAYAEAATTGALPGDPTRYRGVQAAIRASHESR